MERALLQIAGDADVKRASQAAHNVDTITSPLAQGTLTWN